MFLWIFTYIKYDFQIISKSKKLSNKNGNYNCNNGKTCTYENRYVNLFKQLNFI